MCILVQRVLVAANSCYLYPRYSNSLTNWTMTPIILLIKSQRTPLLLRCQRVYSFFQAPTLDPVHPSYLDEPFTVLAPSLIPFSLGPTRTNCAPPHVAPNCQRPLHACIVRRVSSRALHPSIPLLQCRAYQAKSSSCPVPRCSQLSVPMHCPRCTGFSPCLAPKSSWRSAPLH
jgi:hypothetical protein